MTEGTHRVYFGNLALELHGLGDLGELSSIYSQHRAPDDAAPASVVRVSIETDAGSDHHHDPSGPAWTWKLEQRRLEVQGALWRLVIPLTADEPVQALMEQWRPEQFDLLMDCLVQVLAPVRGGGLVLHASCVERDGLAYVFAAQRETGKTTVARFSRDLGFAILAEEMAYVAPGRPGSRALAYSLPLLEKNRMNTASRRCVPLAGIYLLAQSREDRVERLSPRQRVLGLSRVAAIAIRSGEVAGPALEVIEGLASRDEPKRLHFTRSPRFWTSIDAAGRAGGVSKMSG